MRKQRMRMKILSRTMCTIMRYSLGNSKRKFLFVCIWLLISSACTLLKAQTVNYSYDTSGNVVSKKVVQPVQGTLYIPGDNSFQLPAGSFMNGQIGTVDTAAGLTPEINQKSETDSGETEDTPAMGSSADESIALYLSDGTAYPWMIEHRKTHTTHH